jgi:hypothetical protein
MDLLILHHAMLMFFHFRFSSRRSAASASLNHFIISHIWDRSLEQRMIFSLTFGIDLHRIPEIDLTSGIVYLSYHIDVEKYVVSILAMFQYSVKKKITRGKIA